MKFDKPLQIIYENDVVGSQQMSTPGEDGRIYMVYNTKFNEPTCEVINDSQFINFMRNNKFMSQFSYVSIDTVQCKGGYAIKLNDSSEALKGLDQGKIVIFGRGEGPEIIYNYNFCRDKKKLPQFLANKIQKDLISNVMNPEDRSRKEEWLNRHISEVTKKLNALQ